MHFNEKTNISLTNLLPLYYYLLTLSIGNSIILPDIDVFYIMETTYTCNNIDF